MSIEQELPNKPNFLLIVGLFAVAILLIFGIILATIGIGGKRFTFRHHQNTHPVSRLQAPPTTARS